LNKTHLKPEHSRFLINSLRHKSESFLSVEKKAQMCVVLELTDRKKPLCQQPMVEDIYLPDTGYSTPIKAIFLL
jgi:hypothetical protein